MYLAPWENSGSNYYNYYNQKLGQRDSCFKKMIQLNTNKHWKEQNFKYNEMVFDCYKSIHFVFKMYDIDNSIIIF